MTTAGRVAGALVAFAVVATLSACTPAGRQLTAVRVVDGELVILLAGCSDYQIDRINVHTKADDPTARTSGPDRTLIRTGNTTVPESMPFFQEPPTGWIVTDGGLTTLAAGKSYAMSAMDDIRASTMSIGFTAADLAALGPGEVLIGKDPTSHQKVTEKEFHERAKKAC